MEPRKIFFLNHLSCYINSLGDALSQLGHKLYYQSSWNQQEIEAAIAYFQPEILITVGYDKPMAEFPLEVIPDWCEKYGLLQIYWATEDKIHFERLSQKAVQRLNPDLVWTIHPDCVSMYREKGIMSEFLNFAFNPRLFPEKRDVGPEQYDIAFVGTTHLETRTYRYESLKELLFPLVASPESVHVWGGNWKENAALLKHEFGMALPPSCIHGFLPYKRTVRVYHDSKIMLGVQNARDQVTQRTFEILGCGAFMIASRTEELERLFEHGKEIVYSSEPDETLELARYYLKHPEQRTAIGRMARTKVLSRHTFSRELERLWPNVEQLLKEKRVSFYD